MMEELEKAFLNLCAKYPQGITDKQFREYVPTASLQNLASVINSLSGRVYGLTWADNKHSIVSGLEGDERIVYEAIRVADTKGIWTKDLKFRTNLHQNVLTKLLRALESRRLIKSVRSVKNATRKVYMLYELTPSVELTGGPWFAEHELDTEFIEELCKVCYKFVATKSFPSETSSAIWAAGYSGYPSLGQIHAFISTSGVTNTYLSSTDVETLLERLVYDGMLERIVDVSATPIHSKAIDSDEEAAEVESTTRYRAIKPSLLPSALAEIPCGVCPVFDLCAETGPITPGCEYYTKWLAF